MTGTCFLCGKWRPLDTHEIFGASNRKKSIRYGLQIRICRECHTDLHHIHPENYTYLKRDFQRIFEATYSRTQFISEFGKNYLDD